MVITTLIIFRMEMLNLQGDDMRNDNQHVFNEILELCNYVLVLE